MIRSLQACLCAGVVAGLPALADDDRIVDQPEPAVSQPEQQHLIDLAANFDANLFEQQGNGWVLRGGVQFGNGLNVRDRVRVMANGRLIIAGADASGGRPAESPTRASVRLLAEKRLERIAAACALTELQRRDLRLAIESDIRRCTAEIEALRGKYAGVRVNLNDQEGQKTWHQFQQDVQHCRRILRNVLDGDSLFASVLPTTLEAGQLAGIEEETRQRRSFRWRVMVAATLTRMDDMLGLTQVQHDVIEKALLARDPGLRVAELKPEQDTTHLQQNLVYLVLSECEPSSLRKAVSERQWKSLALLMNQGKSMRSWIEQQGILDQPSGPPQR
ncbi:MAG: hypothetical protein FJ286_09975 [Planctomycetes bacterium]|nr:hypothetical protein [Planctomycetota bacterium]